MKRKRNKHFYEKGLRFECTRCGSCCSGFPGYVYLSEMEIKRIARHLMLEPSQFIKRYTKVVHVFGQPRLSLIETAQFDCVFFKNGCVIYEIKPYQCSSYPFWRRHLISLREWKKVGDSCPGINRGRLYSKEEIEYFLNNFPEYNIKTFSAMYGR